MKKIVLTEMLNGGTMISCAESLPPIFPIDVPGVNCAQLFSLHGENLNHSATIAPSGGGMSFINLRGDDVVAQSGGGRSFAGKPPKNKTL